MTEENRTPETKFFKAWEEARPRILWAFLKAVSAGLRNLPTTKPERLPRMADFAHWMLAIEPDIWEPGTFMKHYDANRAEANDVALDSPVGNSVKRMAFDDGLGRIVASNEDGDYGTTYGNGWKGTSTQLLDLLTDHYSTARGLKSDEWPKNARALSAKLNIIRPNLRDVGILYENNRRTITIKA